MTTKNPPVHRKTVLAIAKTTRTLPAFEEHEIIDWHWRISGHRVLIGALWLNMRNALQEGRFSIPDDDGLHADLTSCGYKYDSGGRLVLESKIDMKKRGMPSPDSADAMSLTFSEPEGSPIPRSIALNFNRKIEYPNLGTA
jgi:hypothetical protein